ncbi:hypothetical protein GXW82_17180 [Streptacidiphilus sp. 4-A2]|nr:hypothetical protein [Streptacidiphilus sp. 4-A2]
MRFSAVRSAEDSPDTTINCTLTVYNPFFAEGGSYGEAVEATAEAECTGS